VACEWMERSSFVRDGEGFTATKSVPREDFDIHGTFKGGLRSRRVTASSRDVRRRGLKRGENGDVQALSLD
jgi:hypothetical protein